MTYIDPDLITDETATAEAILAGLADRIPGWEPAEGSPETEFGEALGVVIATVATMIVSRQRAEYEGFATRILNLPRGTAEPAHATATISVKDANGPYVIPDGFEFVMRLADGTPIALATVGEVTVPNGSTEATGVPVVTLEPGAEANGLIGTASEFDAVPAVIGVELATAATDGADVEPVERYLPRVADRARRVKVVPITVDDYAALALDHPSVARCLAVKLLDPDNPPAPGADPSSGGHITVFPIDAAGQPVSPAVALEVQALLEGGDRPLAVTVHVEAPEYTPLTPAVEIRLEVGADEPTTIAAVQAAITAYSDKANWGLDETAPGRWRGPVSEVDRPVRHYDIAHVADNVFGVAGVVSATVNGGDEVELTGWAPLPDLTGPPVVTVAAEGSGS